MKYPAWIRRRARRNLERLIPRLRDQRVRALLDVAAAEAYEDNNPGCGQQGLEDAEHRLLKAERRLDAAKEALRS